jgi:hypothetical protein
MQSIQKQKTQYFAPFSLLFLLVVFRSEKRNFYERDNPINIHTKFGSNWPSDSGEENHKIKGLHTPTQRVGLEQSGPHHHLIEN